MIGKISFPIFVFLVSEGFRYTRNRFRYGAMLLVFAFISEIPWNLMHYGTVLSFVDQNVLFRLFAGFLALCIIDRFSDKPMIQGVLLIGILIAAYLLNMSYQVAMMLVFYFLSEKPIVRDFINILIIPGTFLYLHSFALIELYNGKYILYSLSNFCFGGNTGLSDPDTCIVRCEFVMDETNSYVEDYNLTIVPYSQTSFSSNDYCPRPYEWESDDYYRVMDRLNWNQEDE
ncbi:MAG: hypothetical protein II125_01765 [Ruminococcus sp.]|nr:hypothetical protein [Ruminococcus sp.]